jgi:hypothetical protein
VLVPDDDGNVKVASTRRLALRDHVPSLFSYVLCQHQRDVTSALYYLMRRSEPAMYSIVSLIDSSMGFSCFINFS